MASPTPQRRQPQRHATALVPTSTTATEQVVGLEQHPSHPAALLQRARQDTRTLRPREVLQLQRTLGNRAVGRLLAHPAQAPSRPLQGNHSGLPAPLRAGIEHLSGLPMDDVTVHYNSAKPAQLQALAYTQGTEIYVGPGQEKHLAHEAWHVVQQAQGRVQPTMRMKGGVPVNDNKGLEQEAEVMGAKALDNTAQCQGASAPVQQKGPGLHGLHKKKPASILNHFDLVEAERMEQQAASFIGPIQAKLATALPVVQLGRARSHPLRDRTLMVRKLEFVGSGGGLAWRRLNNRVPQATRMVAKGAEYSVRDGKPLELGREHDPSQTYTIGGTDSYPLEDVWGSGHGLRDIGSNTIQKNVELGLELIAGFVQYADLLGQHLVVLIKGHSRGGVAASRVAEAAREIYPEITVEAVFFDPVPGPDHSDEDVDIALGPLYQGTLVYSLAAERSDTLMSPQKVTGVNRLILSKKSHSVSIRAGFRFRGTVFRNYSTNSLPEGVYLGTGEVQHDAPEEIERCVTLMDAMAAVKGARGLGLFESGRLDTIEQVVKSMFPTNQVQEYARAVGGRY